MSKCGHELIFFHNEEKGEMILSFNGDRHVYDDGIAKAVEAERNRIIKLLEGLINTRPTESHYGWKGYSIERVIEMIEGEQK
jgi:hypothetical protein